jgi:hypothetical protein
MTVKFGRDTGGANRSTIVDESRQDFALNRIVPFRNIHDDRTLMGKRCDRRRQGALVSVAVAG